jgi:hypothetical protein
VKILSLLPRFSIKVQDLVNAVGELDLKKKAVLPSGLLFGCKTRKGRKERRSARQICSRILADFASKGSELLKSMLSSSISL